MAKELLPDALCPAGAAEAQGRTAPGVGPGGADGDPVRAEDGHPLGVLACRDGVWERNDVLAQAASGASRRASPGRSHRLGPGRAGLRRGAGPGGGQETGTIRRGCSPPSTPSSPSAPRRAAGPVGDRPSSRPTRVTTTLTSGWPCASAARSEAAVLRIARWGVEPNNRLGRYRWGVARTLSWLNRFRRLKSRYEHRADLHLAFLQLGCALISLRFLG